MHPPPRVSFHETGIIVLGKRTASRSCPAAPPTSLRSCARPLGERRGSSRRVLRCLRSTLRLLPAPVLLPAVPPPRVLQVPRGLHVQSSVSGRCGSGARLWSMSCATLDVHDITELNTALRGNLQTETVTFLFFSEFLWVPSSLFSPLRLRVQPPWRLHRGPTRLWGGSAELR